ncbi:iron complex transport system substrate-binding protein [Austwickia chelonae]|uniref:Putative iron-siderophore ABC transporter substrate-binding protein n=1 Tax=Austwickia chelonae NBRC 105200 TaxID=1184607 RepID=K6VVR2_9MICO|nr:iron-siderophore ABC transporter substrate-binding protein [Austwickia chelonae]GAB79430.1 putative iron-siderophore ABC transporter substrate-binding protein [Austwickia chelonae NBRC 105200]SEW36875.1 iron complex transport system substrate-binding protein [Austwickia chelonae]
MRPPRHLTATLVLALTLTSCATGPRGETKNDNPVKNPDSAPTDSFPINIDHALGTTTIEKAPQRIVTVGWSDHDVVAALGQAPVGATKVTWGGNDKGSTPWFDAKLQELGNPDITRIADTDGIDSEAIAKLNPDLILGVNSGIKQEEFDKLTKIAPTIAYPKAPWATSWEEQLDIIGRATGRSTAARTLREQTDRRIDEALAKYPQIKGKTAAWVWFTPTDLSTVGIYTTTDARPHMLRRFGLTDAPAVSELSNGPAFSTTISAEKAHTVESDVTLFYADDEQLKTLQTHPLISKLPALAANRYFASANNQEVLPLSSPTPLSIPAALDTFLPKLAQAVDGKPAR